MTTLLYRGHDYVQHKEKAIEKHCVELTYRQKHYNTCRANTKEVINGNLNYRGIKYNK